MAKQKQTVPQWLALDADTYHYAALYRIQRHWTTARPWRLTRDFGTLQAAIWSQGFASVADAKAEAERDMENPLPAVGGVIDLMIGKAGRLDNHQAGDTVVMCDLVETLALLTARRLALAETSGVWEVPKGCRVKVLATEYCPIRPPHQTATVEVIDGPKTGTRGIVPRAWVMLD